MTSRRNAWQDWLAICWTWPGSMPARSRCAAAWRPRAGCTSRCRTVELACHPAPCLTFSSPSARPATARSPATGALAWAVPFLLQPLCAVFYPVSVLPMPMQKIAWFIPATHVFEGMRYILAGGKNPDGYLLWACGLNALYWTASVVFFGAMLARARERGSLAKIVN